MLWRLGAAAVACAAGPSAALARGPAEAALALAADQEQDAGKRLKALRESIDALKKGEVDPAMWRESVKKIAWKASNPAKIRLPAIEALLEQDEADSRSMLALMIPREPTRVVVDLACSRAAGGGWKEMTPAIVRSWSRKMLSPPDEERSERAALLAMYPDRPLPDVAFEVFCAPVPPDAGEQSLVRRARADAWTLLCRIDPGLKRTRELLEGADAAASADPTLLALRQSASDLASVPVTGEQLEWLLDLRKSERSAQWEAARAAIGALSPEQREGFELRHVSGVVWASTNRAAWLGLSRKDLLAEAARRLEGRKFHRRMAETAEGAPPPQETLKANDARLVWGDALMILIATDAMADPRVVEALFEQADADREDKTTEYGGLIDPGPGGSGGDFAVTLYPPRGAQRGGDNRFVASPELLSASVASLFQHHFHARSLDEREYAGPSEGDVEYAARFGRNCLVLASLSSGALGVDYYQPDGAVIDLGEIRRTPTDGAKPTGGADR